MLVLQVLVMPILTQIATGYLNNRLQKLLAIGLRENKFIPYLKDILNLMEFKFSTIDPTLLLTTEDSDTIAASRIITEKYLLLYARRYNKIEVFSRKKYGP